MGDAEYVAKQHICVGPIFVLFEPFFYVRAPNLVLHKLPDPPVSFLFQQRDRFLTDVCTGLPPFFPFRPTKRLDSQSILLSLPPFLIEPCPRFILHPTLPSFLFEPRPRFDYRIKTDPHARAMTVSKKVIP